MTAEQIDAGHRAFARQFGKPVVIPACVPERFIDAYAERYRRGAMQTAMDRLEQGDAAGAYEALANAMTFQGE